MTPRAILLTGANGGLGRAIARCFLERSPSDVVFLGVHRNRGEALALADEFEGRAALVDLDVGRPDSWAAAVEAVLKRGGRLDVLVNNAGCHEDSMLLHMTMESWERVLNANLSSVFHGCQAALPAMISQRSGRIVNIASLSALFSPAGQANYAAAKAGVLGLTQSLSKEVARIGITVNAICPGYVETEALAGMDPAQRAAAVQRIPMRRFGKPSEVACAVHFLAGPDASYITGSMLKIDGGIL